MSNVDVTDLLDFKSRLYEKVKHVTVPYDKSRNQDIYESVQTIFGDSAPDNIITLDMVIQCLRIVKLAAGDKADSVIGRL